jgi:hypothetical protein
MGARSYIPQLGRFEQTDPQPGGSANAYAYTDDDPVNESDLSGDYTSTVTYDYEAAELGPAAPGLPQEYAGPGAIFPPPVNMQIEEEFNAHPPWDAPAVFNGEDATEVGGFGGRGRGPINPAWILEYGSRCEQYGGHWQGHKCVGDHPGEGGSINPSQLCEGAGLGAAGWIVAKQALGPAGTAVTVACGIYGGVELVKESL